jgi:soluble lytic murein transglycosylase
MQVMPSTARAPGFGLRPANPNNPDDLARLGREYRAKMQERYGGDLAKMWGAYNAGPGRVDELIGRHGDDWLRHAPRETRNYVRNNLRRLRGN